MKRLAHLTALVASLALAVGTTAALGAEHPDNRVTHGPGAIALAQANGVVRPDDRAIHGPGAATVRHANDVVRPDDRATHGQGAIGVAQVPVIAPSGSTAERVDGFDWLDAGIGAAAALGLGLIAAGGAALLLRRGNAPAYS